MKTKKMNPHEKGLTARYLIWLYKTTKEQLDKIDRKFTQLVIDKDIFSQMSKARGVPKKGKEQFVFKMKEFDEYITNKETRGLEQKYRSSSPGELNADYFFITLKLKAVETTIKKYIGVKGLKDIQYLYEQEMIRRIMESRDHT